MPCMDIKPFLQKPLFLFVGDCAWFVLLRPERTPLPARQIGIRVNLSALKELSYFFTGVEPANERPALAPQLGVVDDSLLFFVARRLQCQFITIDALARALDHRPIRPLIIFISRTQFDATANLAGAIDQLNINHKFICSCLTECLTSFPRLCVCMSAPPADKHRVPSRPF